MDRKTRQVFPVFVIAFAIRFVVSGLTTVTNLNPASQADANGFENTAALIARGLREGQPYRYVPGSIDLPQLLFPLVSADIYNLWGTFLAPFWLLPGPSGFYARLGNAFLGTLAIYNVYLIARYYHSHHAGVVATIPLIFYPSVVAVQSTLLREAIVLFSITAAARFLIVPSKQRSWILSYIIAGGALHIALLQRSDNFIIYMTAIAVALMLCAVKSKSFSSRAIGIGVALSPVAFVLSLPFVRDGIEFLARTREVRASGRTVYLSDVIPRTLLEFTAFSWIGAAYFLFTPFPWMIETVPDLLIGIEGLINIVFTIAAVWSIHSLRQKNAPATAGLLVGLAVAVVLYGVGTVNYGTGMRHRQMFMWVLFLFGGIGITEHVRFA
jgi:4-amino-4-deoxy-L-arabinose transferase-like glycosyltransferase